MVRTNRQLAAAGGGNIGDVEGWRLAIAMRVARMDEIRNKHTRRISCSRGSIGSKREKSATKMVW